MSEMASKRLISGRSMKLVAGGVSLVVLAVLAVLTAGFLADDSGPKTPGDAASTSGNPVVTGSGTGPALPSGGPALHAAIAKSDVELVRILIDGGADVNARDTFGEPVLHAAIGEGDAGMVRILVDAGANVNASDTFGEPALHRAILKSDGNIVRILVEAGADVNISNVFGDSALEIAVSEDDEEILQILLEAPGG